MENNDLKVVPIADNENYQSNFKNTGAFEHSSTTAYNNGGNSNGGGENMNDSVTHRELDQSVESLQKDIKISQVETSKEITAISGKIDTQSESIRGLTKLTWWVMAIISAGIIVPFISLFIKTVF